MGSTAGRVAAYQLCVAQGDAGTMREKPAESIAQSFVAAWNRKDAEALSNLFVTDADFINVTGLYWNTREDIRLAHDYGFRRIFSESILEIEATHTRMLGAEVAVVIAFFRLSGQTPLIDRKAGVRHTAMTFVCTLTDGRWRAVSAQNTDRIPGAETFIRVDGKLHPVSYKDSQNLDSLIRSK
jgi:uncharacterized protein (TIGR02246 family)